MRWIVLLLASLLLHVIAFNWADGRIGMPSWHTRQPAVITTELHREPVPAPPAPKPVTADPTPKLKARPQQRPAPPPPAPPVAEATPSLAQPAAEATDTSANAVTGPAETVSAAETQGGQAATQESKPQEAAAVRYKISPPPPAELKYDVEALRDGKNWHGTGMYRWEPSGNSYKATVEASIRVLFKVTLLNIKSEGVINDFGIAPVLYSEKPFNKSLTNTHFQHQNGKISFSASEAVYPYNGGEQDRASIIWQLAGIGRGDPDQFVPGANIDIVVAGNRDAETWHIQVVGAEEVDTPYGKVNAWHVVRLPPAGTYEKKYDIWLAPQQEWYPIKVRETDKNGNYLELALASVEPVAR